jgi:hypothetical protein
MKQQSKRQQPELGDPALTFQPLLKKRKEKHYG